MRARLQSNPLLVQFNALSLQSNSLWQFLFRRKHFHWKDTTGDEYQREIRYTCTQICHNGKNSIQVRVQYNVIWGREHPNEKARRFIMYQLFGEIRFTFAGLSRDVRSASPSFWNVTHSLEGKFRGQARWPHSRGCCRRRSCHRHSHRCHCRTELDIFPSQTRGRSVVCHQTNDSHILSFQPASIGQCGRRKLFCKRFL